MNVFRYLKSLGETNSGQSSKAFAVVVSTIVSGLMGITLCGAIAYDVYVDGVIDSDMQDMGILMLCMGGFVGGSSVSKIFGDKAEERIAAEMSDVNDYEPPRRKPQPKKPIVTMDRRPKSKAKKTEEEVVLEEDEEA